MNYVTVKCVVVRIAEGMALKFTCNTRTYDKLIQKMVNAEYILLGYVCVLTNVRVHGSVCLIYFRSKCKESVCVLFSSGLTVIS